MKSGESLLSHGMAMISRPTFIFYFADLVCGSVRYRQASMTLHESKNSSTRAGSDDDLLSSSSGKAVLCH